HRRAELGFAVAKRHWGRRIASHAVPAVLEFGFERIGLHRIEAEVDPDNSASIRVLARAGFKREGWRRQRYLEGGDARDSIFYGLLRTEAPAGPPGSLAGKKPAGRGRDSCRLPSGMQRDARIHVV